MLDTGIIACHLIRVRCINQGSCDKTVTVSPLSCIINVRMSDSLRAIEETNDLYRFIADDLLSYFLYNIFFCSINIIFETLNYKFSHIESIYYIFFLKLYSLLYEIVIGEVIFYFLIFESLK